MLTVERRRRAVAAARQAYWPRGPDSLRPHSGFGGRESDEARLVPS